MGTIGENLKRLRKEAGLSQVTLAEQSGVSQQLISQIERGVNQSTKELPALAHTLDVPVHEIDEEYVLAGAAAPARKVPIVSWVSAGNLRDQPGVSQHEIERWINVGDLPPSEWVALIVQGDSMDLIAPDGAIILVDRGDDKLIDNRFYVFALGNGEATFKQYRRTPHVHLRPFSSNTYDHVTIPVRDDDELYVFGRVRRIIVDV